MNDTLHRIESNTLGYMTEKEIDKKTEQLVVAVLSKRPVKLRPDQRSKFSELCRRIIEDNPDEGDTGLVIGASVALNLLIAFPNSDL